jgi:hypothetical protein
MSVPELKITGNVKQNKVDVSGSLQGNSYMQWKIPGCIWRWAEQRRYQRRAGGERSQSGCHHRCAESG